MRAATATDARRAVQAKRLADAQTAGGDPTLRLPPPVGSGLDASPWPLYRGDLLRTGREAGSGATEAPGLAAPPRLEWKFFANQSHGAANAAPAPILSSPVIGADGSIYFGSLDGYVYALFSDGAGC